MKKLFLLGLTVLSMFTLVACDDESVSEEVLTVLDTIEVNSEVSGDFTLTVAKDNIEINWESNNSAIAIDGAKATVTQGAADVNVILTATGVKGDLKASKEFTVKVLKEAGNQVDVLADALIATDGTNVSLEGLTIQTVIEGAGAYVTDGTSIMYIYNTTTLDFEVGDVVDVNATVGSYNNLKQLTNATLTESTESATIYAAVDSTIAVLSANEMNSGYFTITGTIYVSGTTVTIKDGISSTYLELTNKNDQTSLAVLQGLNGVEAKLNVYLNTYSWGSSRYVSFDGTLEDLTIASDAYLNAVKNTLSLPSSTLVNLDLPTTGNFNSTITWSSNNTSVIANDGTINRQNTDTDVTLTATITIGANSVTKDFVLTVISSEQTVSNDVFISEYYEGKSNDKYIEIYNPSAQTVDLTDYTLKLGSNGAAFSTSYTFTTGTLAQGQCIIIANSSSHADIKAKVDTYSQGNSVYVGVAGFNGDDAIGLFKGEELIDIFGVEGTDPGSSWVVGEGTTLDHRIVRKPGFGANTTWNADEWQETAISATGTVIDNMGIHTFELDSIVLNVLAIVEEKKFQLEV